MAIEDLIVSLVTALINSSIVNLILIILIIFFLHQVDRYIKEHRDMRSRLTTLEAKIRTYEDIGIMDNVYKELKGKKSQEMMDILDRSSATVIGIQHAKPATK